MSEAPITIGIQRTSMLNGINRVGKFLKAVGLDPFKLNAEDIIAKAVKKSGFEGKVPVQAQEGLKLLVNSINQESKPNAFGSLAAKTLFERTMHARLKVESVLAKDASVAKAPINEPIFIIGMPRTGTTILHAMMHEDPAHRSPLSWECLLPYPVPKPENFTDNPQLATVTKEFGQLFQLVPDFQKKHHMEPDSPQECIGVNALDFNSFQTSAQFYIPSYMDWFYNKASKLETMKWHKRFLQYLQSGGVKADRWLLKSPVHLIRLEEIFAVYPDAKIIMTHRHPAKVVASAASLISSVRSLYSDSEDAFRSGKEQAATWSDCYNRFLASRKKLNKENQIIDLKFEEFVSDQVGTIEKIYNRFNWNFTAEAKQKMTTFLAKNPKDKHGAHNYTLEDFGLKESEINTQFEEYIEFLKTL